MSREELGDLDVQWDSNIEDVRGGEIKALRDRLAEALSGAASGHVWTPPLHELGSEANPLGGPYDITPNGKFARSRTEKKILVIHWGSHNVARLSNYFRTTDRSVSAHWACDESGAWQMLENDRWAYHAGWINRYSLGLDIAAQPVTRFEQEYKAAGRDVEVVPNPTNRGDRRVLTLDPTIATVARSTVFRLCSQLGIPLVVPRDKDGNVRHDVVFRDESDLGDWSGVIGHHHCASNKWDIAPWWAQLFDGTPLGNPR